jgi:lauroyl/myristoyl acyltransferase
MRLCHRVPVLKWAGKAVPPFWFFKRAQWNIAILSSVFGYGRREIQDISQVLDGHFDAEERRELAKKYLIYRRWRRNLVDAWPNWVGKIDDWSVVDGEEHLTAALEEKKGAILLSGHGYGFSQFVSPILAQRGYRVFRTGMGRRAVHRVERWGKGSYRRWEYFNYYGTAWHRVRVLNRMREALKGNGVLQVEITGASRGDSRLEIPFWYGRFFLDARVLRLVETLDAPVLPCFALCDEKGKLVVKIYPPIGPSTEQVVATFSALYAHYLRTLPEFSPIWRRVVRQKEEF